MDMTSEGVHIARAQAAHDAGLPTAAPGEYLTFRLGDGEYGVDIQQVQEIRSFDAPTRIPGTPAYVKGVVNLRGAIVPIIDLRMRLDCDSAEYNPFTVVIVLRVLQRVVGVVVDAVSDVLDLEADAIRPPPELSASGSEFVTAIASVDERMLMLVAMDQLLGETLGGLPGAQ